MSQDREFENYMQGKSGLSDLYADLPQDKLPSHLDAAILAEAHRAVGARPGGKPRRSWVIPLSMAASLFVAVIIGLQLPYLLPGGSVPSQMRQEEKHQEEKHQEEKQKAAKMEMAAADRSAPPPAAPAKVAPEQKQSRAQANNQPGVPPAEPAPVTLAAKAVISLNAAAPQRVPPEPAPTMAKPAQAFDKKPMDAMAVAPAAPVEAPPVVAERPARLYEQAEPGNGAALKKERRQRSSAEGNAADYSTQPAAAAGTIVAAPETAGLASPQAETKADMVNLPPKEWLARIRQLKQQGKTDEGKKELAAFRKRYPDYSVPKDLETR
jgi:hypothetical protein